MGISCRKKPVKKLGYLIHGHDVNKGQAMLWYLVSEDVANRFNGRKEDEELWKLACSETSNAIVECLYNHGIDISDTLEDFEEFKK